MNEKIILLITLILECRSYINSFIISYGILYVYLFYKFFIDLQLSNLYSKTKQVKIFFFNSFLLDVIFKFFSGISSSLFILIVLLFFIDWPAYQDLLSTRICVRYAICVLMLLYLLKNFKLLYLLVFSKYRIRHIKRLLAPFSCKPYLEVEIAFRFLTFICISKMGFWLYTISSNFFSFFIFLVIFVFLIYVYVVGSIAKNNSNLIRPFHYIKVAKRVSKNRKYLRKTLKNGKSKKVYNIQIKSFHDSRIHYAFFDWELWANTGILKPVETKPNVFHPILHETLNEHGLNLSENIDSKNAELRKAYRIDAEKSMELMGKNSHIGSFNYVMGVIIAPFAQHEDVVTRACLGEGSTLALKDRLLYLESMRKSLFNEDEIAWCDFEISKWRKLQEVDAYNKTFTEGFYDRYGRELKTYTVNLNSAGIEDGMAHNSNYRKYTIFAQLVDQNSAKIDKGLKSILRVIKFKNLSGF